MEVVSYSTFTCNTSERESFPPRAPSAPAFLLPMAPKAKGSSSRGVSKKRTATKATSRAGGKSLKLPPGVSPLQMQSFMEMAIGMRDRMPWEDSDDSEFDSDEDEYDEDDDTGDPALDRVREQLGKAGCDVLLLEECPKDVTLAKLLKVRHLLLPKDVVGTAMSHRTKMLSLVYNWMGGGTSCGNEIWLRYLIPLSKQAAKSVQAKKWKEAFGTLLGLALFAYEEDGWIHDNEVYLEPSFKAFFKSFSTSWKALLSQGDAALGLAPPAGKAGGYRADLKQLLKKMQVSVNSDLSGLYDDQGKPRVAIV
jgi:hypothetical protein